MKKIETTIGRLCHIRKRVADVAPELTDFGMRVGTAMATIIETGRAGRTWVNERCAIYVTEAEWAIIKPIMQSEEEIFPSWGSATYGLWDTQERADFDHRTTVKNAPMRTDTNFYSPYVRED